MASGVYCNDYICDSVYRYEVNFQTGLQCGGAYIKLLTSAENLQLVTATATA